MTTAPFTPDNWKQPENIAGSFQCVDSIFNCTTLNSEPAKVHEFEVAQQDILGIPVDMGNGNEQPLNEVLNATHSDALLVIKDGKIAAEHYFNGMSVDQRHLLNSVTKSFVGMLAGIAVARGQLGTEDLVTDYLPELSGSAWSGATVRQVLDMSASVQYTEDYSDPASGFNEESAIVGWRSPLPGDRNCKTLFDFALSLEHGEIEHGQVFYYRTVCTNMLGMIIEKAMQRPLDELFQNEIWSKLGAKTDAALVKDNTGFPYVGAGLNTSARDLARFGMMLANNGSLGDHQIIPADWVKDTIIGNDQCKSEFKTSKYGEAMPGWHYRNQCWIPAFGRDVIVGIGIHGQALFVDQTNNTVIVKFSSQPQAEILEMHLAGLAAMNAISLHLSS